MNTENRRSKYLSRLFVSAGNILFFCLLPAIFISCSAKRTDMRTLVPSDSLAYLETNDVAEALRPLVNSKSFKESAKTKPDLSALKGVQLAIAVMGFETTEQKLTDEHSIGNVRPHFIVIADTHAWNYQAIGFAEREIGGFVKNVYDSEPALERSDKYGGTFFTWTASDGRKAYALVIDSVIFFGNDETVIEKCLSVRRGEADSIARSGKIKTADAQALAAGYVSTDGVAQIANLAGIKFAADVGDDPQIQSAVAGILPTLVRNSVSDVTWTCRGLENGIEDRYAIAMLPKVAGTLNETMAPSASVDGSLIQTLPANIPNVTFYNLKDPQVAWRSVLLTAQASVDPFGGKLIAEFSNLVFEPYGIANGELFLASVGANIVTARFDADDESSLVVATVKDKENVIRSLSSDFSPSTAPVEAGESQVLISADDGLTATFFDDKVVIGDKDSVSKFFAIRNASDRPDLGLVPAKDATSVTRSYDDVTPSKLAEILSSGITDKKGVMAASTTETRFTGSGIERRTVSDLGLIGSLIVQLAGEQ